MNSLIEYRSLKILLWPFCLFAFAVMFCSHAAAQEQPPRPLQVTVYQNLSFGAFIQGNTGGEVIIDPQGSRSVTGDLIPVNMGYSYYPAIFRIDAIPGTLINILFDPGYVPLVGNNGGKLWLHVDTSLPSSPFVNTKSTSTEVRIGGMLTVGNAIDNPAGNYTGTFSITFVQQ